jgi:hypothetical protein
MIASYAMSASPDDEHDELLEQLYGLTPQEIEAFKAGISEKVAEARKQGFEDAAKAFKQQAKTEPSRADPDVGTTASVHPASRFHLTGAVTPVYKSSEPKDPIEEMVAESRRKVARGQPTRRGR